MPSKTKSLLLRKIQCCGETIPRACLNIAYLLKGLLCKKKNIAVNLTYQKQKAKLVWEKKASSKVQFYLIHSFINSVSLGS